VELGVVPQQLQVDGAVGVGIEDELPELPR
jgi:hypothetical protein